MAITIAKSDPKYKEKSERKNDPEYTNPEYRDTPQKSVVNPATKKEAVKNVKAS